MQGPSTHSNSVTTGVAVRPSAVQSGPTDGYVARCSAAILQGALANGYVAVASAVAFGCPAAQANVVTTTGVIAQSTAHGHVIATAGGALQCTITNGHITAASVALAQPTVERFLANGCISVSQLKVHGVRANSSVAVADDVEKKCASTDGHVTVAGRIKQQCRCANGYVKAGVRCKTSIPAQGNIVRHRGIGIIGAISRIIFNITRTSIH